MERDNNSVELAIYKKYYLADETSEHLVSSHWKSHKERFEVKISNGEILPLKGKGFGDMQNKSKISQVLNWMTIGSYLLRLENKIELLKLMKTAIPLARRMGLVFSYDSFRQVCSLNLIMSKMREKKVNVLNIGDGYGFLSALIKEIIPEASIFMVDLGKTLLFQSYYCRKAHPMHAHLLVLDSDLSEKTKITPDFVYCPTECLERLDKIHFDLVINVVSMQEMNTNTVGMYFNFIRHHVRSDNLFYCCNREKKEMVGGEISEFLKYPWINEDVHLVDEYCPWVKYLFSLKKINKRLSLIGFKIPFTLVYYFEAHRHRLTILKPSSS